MFDIHCHILHGVDDGSGNMSDSIEMAQLAAESGTKGIVVTPHCNIPGMFENYWCKELADKVNALRQEINKRNIPLEIYQGQEVFLSRHFEEHLANGEFITLNNSRYMLVELDFRIDGESAFSKLEKLVSLGYVPVVAHPERYGFIIENPAQVSKIRSLGCLVQLNSGSLAGDFGHYIQKTANVIAQKRLADFIASDAHSQYSRTPNLSPVHELVCEEISYDYADILFRTNPLKVLNNETI